MDRECINDKKSFKDKIKDKAKDKLFKFGDWVRRNPELAYVIVVGTGYIVPRAIRAKKKYNNAHPKETFDPTCGFNMPLKRRMSNRDKRLISEYMDAGYTKHEALKILNLI